LRSALALVQRALSANAAMSCFLFMLYLFGIAPGKH
jgi:hypothetical protein